jgi:hypothetical protein
MAKRAPNPLYAGSLTPAGRLRSPRQFCICEQVVENRSLANTPAAGGYRQGRRRVVQVKSLIFGANLLFARRPLA